MGPFQAMLGASRMGAVLIAPVTFMTGQYITPRWPLPTPQLAHLLASVMHVPIYATYVWLAVRSGAVFAVQVSYMVIGFGLIWAWLMLGESYAATLWLALATIFSGMNLMQPRPMLAGDDGMDHSER